MYCLGIRYDLPGLFYLGHILRASALVRVLGGDAESFKMVCKGMQAVSGLATSCVSLLSMLPVSNGQSCARAELCYYSSCCAGRSSFDAVTAIPVATHSFELTLTTSYFCVYSPRQLSPAGNAPRREQFTSTFQRHC